MRVSINENKNGFKIHDDGILSYEEGFL